MGLKRSLRFLGVTMVMATLMSFVTFAPVSADTGGATLKASSATIKQRIVRSDGSQAGGNVDFTGTGFGPGEVVSIYITFPDGRVFPVVNFDAISNPPRNTPQADEVLADGTGSFTFRLRFGPIFNGNATFPSVTGSATDDTRFTSTIFILPPEFANSVPPYGKYTVTAIGRVSLVSATATFTITSSQGDDFSRNTTGTLTVFTTIGHRTSGRQVDPELNPTGVVENPNVDIACNGLIPGEAVTFWDTYPDGTVVPLGTIRADDGGTALYQLELLTGKFPTGTHTFSCRGNTSNYVFTGSFLVLPGGGGNGTIPGQSAIGSLVCSFTGSNQAVSNATFPNLPAFFASDFLVCTARNFRPNETVTFFQTFPDQTVHFLATIKSNEAGVAVLVIQLFPGPIDFQRGRAVLGDAALYQIAFPAGVDGRIPTGRQSITARGDTTQRNAIFTFDLLPSQVTP